MNFLKNMSAFNRGIFLLIFWLIQCGSATETPVPPAQKCQVLMSAVCNRIIRCAVNGELIAEQNLTTQLKDCADRLNGQCSTIERITPEYDSCIADVQEAECHPIVAALEQREAAPLPASCTGVMVPRASAPQ